ncbi:MAG: SIR2 family protein [Candidatus Aenigmarchaeota archaeon]|nr:SIR2 family protein [Candidatus Aenigmarchaeota archaeon]
MEDPLKVVYLFGAGATQAEVVRFDPDVDLTMPAVTERIFDRKIPTVSDLNALRVYFSGTVSSALNVEHIISLLESLEIEKYRTMASVLRKLFQEDILENLIKKDNYVSPDLTKALLKFHTLDEVKIHETLNGVISLNYDSLLDIAFQYVFGEVNYGINCISETYKTSQSENSTPLLLKIHGSFNWKQGIPIVISEGMDFLKTYSSVWIPPSINKSIQNFPFNHIWGEAFELLNCDLLRVIGCSLNQNDWGLLDLLFKTQFLSPKPYKIELVVSPKKCNEIKEKFAFLKNVVAIEDLDIPLFSDMEFNEKGNYVGEDSNFYERWLKTKIKSFAKFIQNKDVKEEINRLVAEEIL